MDKQPIRPTANRTVCTKCLRARPSDDLAVHIWCAKCRGEYYKAYNAKRYSSPEARAAELAKNKDEYWKPKGLRWARIDRKRQLIQLMGGRCIRCGYNRSASALDFHHIDRNEKGRGISQLLAVTQSWGFEMALEEAKKCELLCSNCHREETWPGHELRPPEADF